MCVDYGMRYWVVCVGVGLLVGSNVFMYVVVVVFNGINIIYIGSIDIVVNGESVEDG